MYNLLPFLTEIYVVMLEKYFNGKSDCLAAQAAKVDFPEPASPSIKTNEIQEFFQEIHNLPKTESIMILNEFKTQ